MLPIRSLLLAVGVLGASASAQTVIGPTPYLISYDSPFFSFPRWHYEDMEDGTFDLGGVSLSGQGLCVPSNRCFPINIDSVDGDDGFVNGVSLFGHSISAWGSGITVTFDPVVLGGLPTSAGLVWTDGGNPVNFNATDGRQVIGFVAGANIADRRFDGTVAEDRFFGITNAGGVGSLFIQGGGGTIEIDHIQYALDRAVISPLGQPCNAGLPRLLAGRPVLGRAMSVQVRGARPGASGFVLLGAPEPSPVRLAGGCLLHVRDSAPLLPVAADGAGAWNGSLQLPPDLVLDGVPFAMQVVVAPSPNGFDLSNGLIGRIGQD